MKNVYLLIFSGLLSSNAYSDDLVSPFQLGVGVAVSSINDEIRENESLGYELSLGYQFNENVILETGYADYHFTDMNVTPWFTRLKGVLPVSDYASLYLGAGVAVDKEISSPLISGGIKYQMSRNWDLDVGYQSVFNIISEDRDITSLLISFRYKLPASPVHTHVLEEEKLKSIKLVKPIKEVKPVSKKEMCQIKLKQYKIRKGDYLYKIARNNNMHFDELLELNESFVRKGNLDLVYPGEVVNLNYYSCK